MITLFKNATILTLGEADRIIDPSFIRTERVRIDVELAGEHTTGATVMRADETGHIDFGVSVDVDRFESWLGERLA